MHRLLLLVLAVVPLAPLAAQDPPPRPPVPSPHGLWEATLEVGAVKLRLALHVDVSTTGYVAKLDSLDQGAKGIAVDTFTCVDGKVAFAIAALGVRYEGAFDATKGEIAGQFRQGPVDVALVWKRVERLTEVRRPQEPKPPFPYTTEEVEYSHDPSAELDSSFVPEARRDDQARVTLAGTLSLPPGPGPHPAVVLVSGSGPQDRDEALLGHKPFAVLADHLVRRGIAVLRYDDRGVARSTGKFGGATTADFATDALAGARFLATRKDIDPARIGIAGHSEGGLVGPMAAARDGKLAFVVMLAGPGVNGREILVHQGALLQRAGGVPAEHVERERPLRRAILEAAVAAGVPLEDRRKNAAAALGAFFDAMSPPGVQREAFVAEQMQTLFAPWMQAFMALEPAEALAKVRCPVLAVWGSLDLQVDPAQSLAPVAAALATSRHADHALVVLPGLNHLFQRATTGAFAEYAQIEETMNPAVLDLVADWIARHTGLPAQRPAKD